MTRFLAFLALLVSLSALPARAEPLTVFAAASLQGALDEIAASHPEPLRLSYGGSGTLARQIAAGAPVDAVILAHPRWLDWLATDAGVTLTARRVIASNRLVLIAPPGTAPLEEPDADSLLAALAGGRLAMGERSAVPAGLYARDWLAHIGAWEALEPHLAETDNVRAALALVARRAAPLGIVYASDALAEPGVVVIHTVPEGSHDPITYPAAALTPAGTRFLEALATPRAAEVLARHGFLPVTP